MSKKVALALKPEFEDRYGEYTNIPVFNVHEEIIGWTGGELPKSGHKCEFNILDDDGFTACVSALILADLKAKNAKLHELIGMICNVCDGTSEVCEYCKNYSATNDECMMLEQMRELEIEVN